LRVKSADRAGELNPPSTMAPRHTEDAMDWSRRGHVVRSEGAVEVM
jgi:hypothetical protein